MNHPLPGSQDAAAKTARVRISSLARAGVNGFWITGLCCLQTRYYRGSSWRKIRVVRRYDMLPVKSQRKDRATPSSRDCPPASSTFSAPQLDFLPVLGCGTFPVARRFSAEHERRIREYLSLQNLDLPSQEQIERWVCGQVPTGSFPLRFCLMRRSCRAHAETARIKRAGIVV